LSLVRLGNRLDVLALGLHSIRNLRASLNRLKNALASLLRKARFNHGLADLIGNRNRVLGLPSRVSSRLRECNQGVNLRLKTLDLGSERLQKSLKLVHAVLSFLNVGICGR